MSTVLSEYMMMMMMMMIIIIMVSTCTVILRLFSLKNAIERTEDQDVINVEIKTKKNVKNVGKKRL